MVAWGTTDAKIAGSLAGPHTSELVVPASRYWVASDSNPDDQETAELCVVVCVIV